MANQQARQTAGCSPCGREAAKRSDYQAGDKVSSGSPPSDGQGSLRDSSPGADSRAGLREPPSKSSRWTWGEVCGSPGGRGVPRTPGAGSRAGTAWRGERPWGQEARRVGGGLVKFAPCASWTGTSCLCFPGGAARPPAAPIAAPLARAPCRTLPSAAAPRALKPRPGSRAVGNGGGAAAAE